MVGLKVKERLKKVGKTAKNVWKMSEKRLEKSGKKSKKVEKSRKTFEKSRIQDCANHYAPGIMICSNIIRKFDRIHSSIIPSSFPSCKLSIAFSRLPTCLFDSLRFKMNK